MVDLPTFEVASFNIRNGLAWDKSHSWPLRSRHTTRAARGLGADVLGVQEAYGFQLRALGKAMPEMQVCGTGRMPNGRGEHVAILVNTDRFTVISDSTRWFGDTPDVAGSKLAGASFPRIATIVHLRDASGQEVVVANTHLDEHHVANRVRSAEMLCEWLLPLSKPTVVLGDMNSTPGSEAIKRFVDAGFTSALAADAGGTEHKFHGNSDGEQIDYLLISDHWTVVDARVQSAGHRRLPSDHWPVSATLALSLRP